jgi:hypothetical protein
VGRGHIIEVEEEKKLLQLLQTTGHIHIKWTGLHLQRFFLCSGSQIQILQTNVAEGGIRRITPVEVKAEAEAKAETETKEIIISKESDT